MKTTLIDNNLVTVPDELGDAIAAVRQDGKMPPGLAKYQFKKKGGKKAEDEESEEEEDNEEMNEDSSDSIVSELLDRSDALVAENAVLRALDTQRQDTEEEGDDEDEDLSDDDIEQLVTDSLEAIVATDAIEQYVAARMDSILEAYDAAKPYLPAEFNLREHTDGYAIKAAALAHSLPKLDAEDSEFNWDSADAIDAGFKILLSQEVRSDSYVPIADRKQAAYHTDMAPAARSAAKRTRKPDYSLN
jgi:hypothetical protein